MKDCIKCGIPAPRGICEKCVEEMINKMGPEDKLAHALVGLDVKLGKKKLQKRLDDYKKLSYNQLHTTFFKRAEAEKGLIE